MAASGESYRSGGGGAGAGGTGVAYGVAVGIVGVAVLVGDGNAVAVGVDGCSVGTRVGAGVAIGLAGMGPGETITVAVGVGDGWMGGRAVGNGTRVGGLVGAAIDVAEAAGRDSLTTTGDDGSPDVDVTHATAATAAMSSSVRNLDVRTWTPMHPSSFTPKDSASVCTLMRRAPRNVAERRAGR
ncbi:MAG: hypothetical protein QF554_11180 [Dehalococcoidia bacterium]|jgi:hypothetical protein|nr:hypothetical protein [Dehalococcoidia bacterium]